ncbi:MAG: RluA family pseudouridine synthase, partial [Alphaproteobacteria bacterium]|nr:RluA family pseudouridine synthase [Alphaproteobacteria bacterium]
MPVKMITVDEKDDNIRVDRWFARHYPELKNGQLQRLIRGKNIRVNGAKTSADTRLHTGDILRVPPMDVSEKSNLPRRLSKADIEFMQSLVIHKDDDVIVLNKPSGIAVQGGSGQARHIDGMLDALRFEKEEKPRLVHRLDKDTSGILLLGRSANAAAKLAEAFASREAKKVYWALVYGKPKLLSGKIDAPLAKMSGEKGGEQMRVDFENGQKAQTLYHVIDSLAKKVSWLEMMPLSGRTHQLRVHCLTLNTPIVGDGKYMDKTRENMGLQDENKLHLHARAIKIPHPRKGTL